MKKSKFRTLATLIALACSSVASLAQIPEGYYDSLKGKKGAELKSAVHDIIKDAKVLSYGSGSGKTWWGFWITDRTSDGRFIDRYSNESTWPMSTSQGAAGAGMNIEHSFPKSWWGKTENQAYKDLYNLMPCESKINSSKSNYPMGEVVSGDTGNGWTKVGNGNDGKKYWEPADEWKGDFARGYMYMATCYSGLPWTGVGLQILEKNDYPTLQKWAYDLYIKWAKADMPNELEITRNNKVSEIQGNRNPFVDFPNLMEYIWGDSIDYAFDPMTTTCSDNYKGDDTPVTPSDVIASYDFTKGECGFTIEDVNNPLDNSNIWVITDTYGWKGTAFKGSCHEADSYLVSPEIDLTGYESAKMNINQAVNFIKTDNVTDRLSVEVRCDGTATVLSGFTWPTGDNWTFVESGDISLNEFAGKKIRVAFRYTSTSTIASTWEIKKMTVSGKKMTDGISDAATITNSKEPRQTFSINGERITDTANHNGIIIVKQGGKSWKITR